MPNQPVVITSGEPAGIGPDLIIQIAQQALPQPLVVIGDTQLFEQRAQSLNLPLTILPWQQDKPSTIHTPGSLYLISTPLDQSCTPGELNSANANYVLNTLNIAIEGCRQGHFAAMVTAPVHKGVINEAGITFSGHTEYLADKTNTEKVVMMLASPSLKVALATTHLPLKAVSEAIDKTLLEQVITILDQDLKQKFGIAKPNISVCGLNPHAGEDGHMGREEIDTIIPALEQLRSKNINLIGPLPADTAFTPKSLAGVDAVLAMYHDQGLPVLKTNSFGEAVNITLGLPIIRTSVDHGTALDIAGTGKADCGSLLAAITMAQTMAAKRVTS